MNQNNKDVILKFKNNSNIKNDKLNDETLKSTIHDIGVIYRKIIILQSRIEKCSNAEELNKIDISSISNDLGLIIQNSILIDEPETKKNIEELNQSYRSLEILYFNKKINMLSNTIDKIANETEQNLKDITGGTLFSIASVFLGISLTSALVAGVQGINNCFVILYFMTCLLISVVTIGIAAIFMRKFDIKSIVILIIIILVSIVWGITAHFTYKNYDEINEVKQKENETTEQNLDKEKQVNLN